MDVALTPPAALATFALVVVRASTLLLAVPMLGMRTIPPTVKIGLSVLLAVLLTPLVPAVGALTPGAFILAVAQEVLLGLLLAFAVTLIFGSFQFAGALLGVQFGFSLANIVDPTMNSQETVVGQFYSILAGLIFFTINGHHLVLVGLARSFEAMPPLGLELTGAAGMTLAGALIDRSGMFFSAALRIAMPIMGALLLTDVAMAVISRSAPQMNVYFVGLPIKIAIGLAAILLALPPAVASFERLFAGIGRDMLMLMGRG